jgi:hypothetical protein
VNEGFSVANLCIVKGRMQDKVTEFVADLMSMGLGRESVSLKGYEFALALQTDNLTTDEKPSSAMMALAAEMVKESLPKAARIYEQRNRMR